MTDVLIDHVTVDRSGIWFRVRAGQAGWEWATAGELADLGVDPVKALDLLESAPRRMAEELGR